ncbi:MAG: helix-turn-helix transcriptional regulator [Erysipelotrichaceae bacterium]|nr:helix-turn-helix transcriptional regulator [Erysipelotrichaceae bacterium]
MDAYKFGCFVAERRKEKNMTQKDLAAKLQVTDKAISKWERGLGFPDINSIEPLADALGVSITELMRSENNTGNNSGKEAEEAVNGVLTVVKEETEEKRKIIVYTFAATTFLLSALEIILSLKWDSVRLMLSASIPYSTVIPGILMIIYGIICKIKGRQTHGIWALGICLLLVPVILFGAAFLLCAIFYS